MLRFAPPLAILILIGPIIFGLAATLLPAMGYFPLLGGSEFSFEPFVRLFQRPGLLQSATISLISGLLTTIVALTTVAIYVAGWSGTATFRKLQYFISPLLSVPHAAAAFGLAFLIAPSGWIMRIISPGLTGFDRPPDWLILNDTWGLTMMLGLVVKEIPFLLLITLAALPQAAPQANQQIAAGLGYGKIAGFIHIVWPNVYRQIRLAVYAVIAYASSVVDVAIILGPSNPAPLSPRLLDWMRDADVLMRFEASAGAILQLAITILALLLWRLGEILFGRVRRYYCNTGRRFTGDRVLRMTGLLWLCITAGMVLLGLAILAIWSVAGYWSFPGVLPDNFTMRNWTRSMPSLGSPLWHTFVIGFAATMLAIMLTLACLEREARTGRTGGGRALLFIYLPLLVPQASFVFGLQLFFVWLGVDATLLALIFVHLVFVLPYVFLSLSDPWRSWDKRYGDVAKGFGAGNNSIFWKIRLPMLVRAVLTASAVGFAVSIGQYLPTALVGAGRLPTITTEAVALAAGGDRRIIGVYAFLQMLLPFFGFALAGLIPALVFRNRRDLKAA